jgi:imidazolonepropionase-like amidohydrolase
VRIFDGTDLRPPGTVVVKEGRIGTDPVGAGFVNCGSGMLLPGLIDAHLHLQGPDTPTALVGYGVTTALDMASWASGE